MLLPTLEMNDALAAHPFTELHRRVIDEPIAMVWPACLDVTAQEIRTLGPLMAVRSLPAMIRKRTAVKMSDPQPLLQVFADAGFMLLRRDEEPVDGRAVVLFGAAGKFWSIAGNAPRTFAGPQEFLDFNDPDFAKTVARLEAIDLGNGTTRIETETWVTGTDPASTRKFAPYWAIIRGPSGLIRRSWLKAIERRLD